MTTLLQTWLINHNSKLTQDAIDEALMEYISKVEKERDELLAALFWVLWHHQGGSSGTGQPIRKLLGIGQYDRLTDEQVEQAKKFIASVKGGA